MGLGQRINFPPNNQNNVGSFVSGIAFAVSAYFETEEGKRGIVVVQMECMGIRLYDGDRI